MQFGDVLIKLEPNGTLNQVDAAGHVVPPVGLGFSGATFTGKGIRPRDGVCQYTMYNGKNKLTVRQTCKVMCLQPELHEWVPAATGYIGPFELRMTHKPHDSAFSLTFWLDDVQVLPLCHGLACAGGEWDQAGELTGSSVTLMYGTDNLNIFTKYDVWVITSS